MKGIIVGAGEVGHCLFDSMKHIHSLRFHDPVKGYVVDSFSFRDEVLLIAIPWSSNFVKDVKKLQERFLPIVTIVFSTVPVGTCRKLGAVHSPIEALHSNNMASYMFHWPRWMAPQDETAVWFFQEVGFQVKVLEDSRQTEYLKLRSTAAYGLAIEFARQSRKAAKMIGMDYDRIMEYDSDYNALNRAMGVPEYQRYILHAPLGNIGGHCIIPNAILLHKWWPSWITEIILKMNGVMK
jgi:hypothetical protein